VAVTTITPYINIAANELISSQISHFMSLPDHRVDGSKKLFTGVTPIKQLWNWSSQTTFVPEFCSIPSVTSERQTQISKMLFHSRNSLLHLSTLISETQQKFGASKKCHVIHHNDNNCQITMNCEQALGGSCQFRSACNCSTDWSL